jgi:hypothetical protein
MYNRVSLWVQVRAEAQIVEQELVLELVLVLEQEQEQESVSANPPILAGVVIDLVDSLYLQRREACLVQQHSFRREV